MIKVVKRLILIVMSCSRSVSVVTELNAGNVYIEVGPMLQVQAVLTGEAELETDFVVRGSWCDGLQIRNNVAYLVML